VALYIEYKTLVDYNTWELVEPPKGQNVADSKWVFKVKCNADESTERYKACLVAKGFTQKAGFRRNFLTSRELYVYTNTSGNCQSIRSRAAPDGCLHCTS